MGIVFVTIIKPIHKPSGGAIILYDYVLATKIRIVFDFNMSRLSCDGNRLVSLIYIIFAGQHE